MKEMIILCHRRGHRETLRSVLETFSSVVWSTAVAVEEWKGEMEVGKFASVSVDFTAANLTGTQCAVT